MIFPRFPLHVGDHLQRTSHLSAIEQGAFLLLVLHYWANEGLPAEERQLDLIARTTPAEWRKHRPTIARLFEPGWRLPWLEAELEDARIARERRSKAGHKGNEAKRRHAQSDRIAFGKRAQCERNAIAMGSLPPTSPPARKSQQEGGYPPEQDALDDSCAIVETWGRA